jgi:hypothetical protein
MGEGTTGHAICNQGLKKQAFLAWPEFAAGAGAYL